MQKNWSKVIREGFIPPRIRSSIPLADAIIIAVGAVANHLRHSKPVRAYIERLPKGAGTSCPDSPVDEIVKYVEMQKGQIDKSDPALTLAFLKEFIMPVLEFERDQVFRAVGACSDASSFDLELCGMSMHLGTLYDALWEKWFAHVVVPYQSLNAEGQEHYRAKAKDVLAPLYDYTVFAYDSEQGITNRMTLAEAFSEEVSVIARAFKNLSLMARRVNDPALSEYFGALSEAHACTDISKLEEYWAEVDRKWIRIPSTCRLIPVHGMESGYEHPFCVSPEFRLDVRTDHSKKEIAERRKGTIEHAHALGLSQELIDNARERLGCNDVSVFCSAVRAGVSANFRYAGQAVPNRQDVLAEGGRIFLDAAGVERMTEIYREKFKKHTTSETHALFSHFITPKSMQNHTIDHEFAHPVGRTKESDEAMGMGLMKNLEEGKASLLGVLADEWRAEHDPEYRVELITLTVARLFRFMHKSMLENATAAPYVRENLVAAYTLFETGVMSMTPEGVAIDAERARSSAWFDALRTFNTEVIAAYQSYDPAQLDLLTEHYCGAYKPIDELKDWVNRT